MLRFFIWSSSILLFLMLPVGINGQEKTDEKVTYKMEAELDDVNHLLKVEYVMTYLNTSDQALPYLIMHVWANAMGDKSSDFAKQLNDAGDRAFYFSKNEALGGYENLVFNADGKKLDYTTWEQKSDVIKLQLPTVLEPGQKVVIESNYTLRIPESFSRLGRGDNSYQLSQWYPKPAVYNESGWHPMPYLQWGEYFSEFGSFDVTIELPSIYRVAATGELRTQSEIDNLNDYAEGNPFRYSEGQYKTINYKAERSHDFAFFVDREWLVEREQFEVDGQEKEAWTFYSPENKDSWEGSAKKVRRAVEFMSMKVGSYPYPQATAVDAELIAGGGMEYPMITVIGGVSSEKMLDQVLAHEVIHNWFYGILANNERTHAWLDEGPTSYYELRYMEEHYDYSIPKAVLPTDKSGWRENHLGYIFDARRAMDLPSNSHSIEYDELGYGISNYAKPQSAIKLLEAYYGEGKVDQAFSQYFDQYKFTHVDEAKLKNVLNEVFEDDISWWFDQVIGSAEVVDYCLTKVKMVEDGWSVKVKNKGKVASPLFLSSESGTEAKFSGFTGSKEVVVPFAKEVESIIIDEDNKTLELHQNNNTIRTSGLFPKIEPLKVRLLPGVPGRDKSDIYLFPIAGWNQYDHWMAGLHLTNIGLLPRKWSYAINPLYSFAENELSGEGKIWMNQSMRTGALRNIQVGVEGKRYNYREVNGTNDAMSFYKISPFISFKWLTDLRRQKHHDLHLRWDYVGEERPDYEGRDFVGTDFENWSRIYLGYQYGRHGALHPWHFNSDLEYGAYRIDGLNEERAYLRMTVSAEWDLYYREKNKIKVRGFLGGFIMNDSRNSSSINSTLARRSLGLAYQGHTDFLDQTFLGRNAASGILARQVGLREGGFKTAFTAPFASTIGSSNDWISSVNIEIDLPGNGWVSGLFKPFIDLGYYSDTGNPVNANPTFSDQFLWSSGISLQLASGAIQFHVPLLNSSNINDALDMAGQTDPWKRISFSFHFKSDKLYHFLENTRLNF